MKYIIATVLIVTVLSCTENKEEPCVEKAWYFDVDGDGKGDRNKEYLACEMPAGFVANKDDDDDAPAGSIIPLKGYTTPLTYTDRKLIWSDEFTGSTLDEKYWNYELGNNGGWGNNELQIYNKESTQIKDGNLLITATRNGSAYNSSRLTTQGKFDFKFGRVDIRAALPKGQGIWPALWLLGKNIGTVGWPKCGEIDIMEMIGGGADGRDNTTHGTVHWDNAGSYANYGGSYKQASGALNGEFHVFSIVWDEKKIVWYIDDKQYHVIDITPKELDELTKEQFLIVNLAVGGNWPGNPDASTTFPQYFAVDYIRVFQ